MAFAPTSITQLTGISSFLDPFGVPASSGVSLDRLSSGASLESLAAPSALTGQFQQVLQNQQLSQLAQMLALLMQNRNSITAEVPSGSAAGTSAIKSAGGTSTPSSNGVSPSGEKSALKGNGSTVERQGKPIGAHIAKQFDDMVAAAKKDGVNITITSGARSRAEQERLYAAYKNGTGNLAAKPGTSNHESGDALDLGPPAAYGWLKQNAARFNFKNTITSEPWHWSLSGN